MYRWQDLEPVFERQWNWNRFQLCINHVTQGSCADVLKVAMVQLDTQLPTDAHLVICNHDELVLDVSQKEAEGLCKLTQQVMETAFQQVFQTDLFVFDQVSVDTLKAKGITFEPSSGGAGNRWIGRP